MVGEGEGGEWVQSPHSGLLFSISLLASSVQQTDNTEKKSKALPSCLDIACN